MIDPLFKSKQAKDESSFPLPMLSLLCVFMLLASPLAAQTVDVRDACDPSVNDPEAASYKVDYDGNGLLEICYLEDLNAMRYALDGWAYVESRGATLNTSGCPTPSGATNPRCHGYELVRDLDFLDPANYKDATSNLALYTENAGWEPVGEAIGFRINPFEAIFNGNRYTLSNLRINRPQDSDIGLFGYLSEGTIENIGLINVNIKGSVWVGGLVGRMQFSLLTGNYVVGGSIEGTSNRTDVIGVGGLIGEVNTNNTVIGNYANVTVIAHTSGGGLIGYWDGNSEGTTTISNNYATSHISGTDSAGGFIGNVFAAEQIFNSLHNYASSSVAGDNVVGGFIASIGGNTENFNLAGNYWDADASGQRRNAGEAPGEITSLTTVTMITPTAPATTSSEAYYHWDTAYWDFGTELQYPALRYTTANSALGQKVGELLRHQRSRLDSLTVSSPDATTQNLIAFAPTQFNYEILVPHTSERIAVQPLPDARHATLTIIVNDTPLLPTTDAAPYIINLNEIGTYTTITVAVKRPHYLVAERYTLAVFRAAPPPTLSTLTLSDGALVFDEDTSNYELAVANNIATLTVEATASNPNAEITVYRNHIAESQRESLSTPIALTEGTTTTLLIRVTTPGKGENLYTIRVKRAPSTNAKLAALSFAHDAALIAFDAARTQYNVEIEGHQRVTVVLETANEHASVVVESNGNPIAADTEGNYPIDLTLGGRTEIEIFITAQDRMAIETYTITVTQRAGTQAALTELRLTDTTGKDLELTTHTSITYSAELFMSTQTRLYLTASLGASVIVTVHDRIVSKQSEGGLEYYPITLLSDTSTEISISVTAQDGIAMRTYTIAVVQRTGSQAALRELHVTDTAGKDVDLTTQTSISYDAEVSIATQTRLHLTASLGASVAVTVDDRIVSKRSEAGLEYYPITLAISTVTQITIVVTSQNSAVTTTYTLAIKHTANAEAQLEELNPSHGALTPDFSPTIRDYRLLETSRTRLTIRARASVGATISASTNSQPIFPNSQGNYPIDLNQLPLQLRIIVVSQNLAVMTTYTLTITRTASSEAQLKSLELSHGTLVLDFSATAQNYSVSQTTATHLTIRASASIGATISVMAANQIIHPDSQGDYPIDLSQLPITITITAQDGTTQSTYTLTASPADDALRIRIKLFLEAPLP